MEVVSQELFSTINRLDAPDVVIVLTDGPTNNWEAQVIPAVNQLKELQATIIPIGLFNGISEDRLRQLASNPTEAVTAIDTNDLQSKVSIVEASACQHRIAGKYISSFPIYSNFVIILYHPFYSNS